MFSSKVQQTVLEKPLKASKAVLMAPKPVAVG